MSDTPEILGMQEGLHGTKCIACSAPEVELDRHEDGAHIIRCSVCESELGVFVEDEYRLDWASRGLDEKLQARVDTEVKKYDTWAKETADLDYPAQENITLDAWFGRSEMMRQAASRWPGVKNISGKRVLDVGGSCKDSWRFPAAGARRIDQVEVSPHSQQVAIQRLDEALRATGVAWRGKVWFHTAPAERLPFQENTFDFVFSRATIHHTKRPEAFHEIHRVLKPGGLMFIIEPRYSLLMYALVLVSRFLRGADRGTDDPLRTSEIRALRDDFEEVDWYPNRFISMLWQQSVGRFVDRPDVLGRLRAWERSRGDFGGVAYLTGSQCWVVARK